MIDRKRLLSDLQSQQRKLEADLRAQALGLPELADRLQADYAAARAAGRTAETFSEWREGEMTQGAVAWLISGVFLRFVEDNGLIAEPLLAGPGVRLGLAGESMRGYFREHPTDHDRHYLLHAFGLLGQQRALAGLFDPAHNPLFRFPPSPEAAQALVAFWRQVDPDTGALVHDFCDAALNTRFLGDLYQDLSEAARKRFALLQTPEFVEEFILDRTLDPALRSFGHEGLRLIDPTCGSGHFLLGAFARLLRAWELAAPGMDVRERVAHALESVHGVDLNPFAVAIARFRLLIAALRATCIRTLKEAPGWRLNLTTGDSLLHGRRFGELDLGGDQLDARYNHVYASEDRAEIQRILGQQYHAVVGNPPYITASDAALNQLYRARYRTCHMKFSLGVPFTERFFQLALNDPRQPAGYVGLITTNSFMKREFGSKLIEGFLPRQDLTHVIDTSGAYIPGHGTPTVILFGRHRAPVRDHVRAVLGIRGEPSTPDDPAAGLVWSSIVRLIDRAGSANDYVSVSDMARATLAKHPWSLQGGAAPTITRQIEDGATTRLGAEVESIGFASFTGLDDAFVAAASALSRAGVPLRLVKNFVHGESARDWRVDSELSALAPYDETFDAVDLASGLPWGQFLWVNRTSLGAVLSFGGRTRAQCGDAWWTWYRWVPEKYQRPLTITFAFVATHNHFVLDRGGKVFNRSAPVIKLPAGASEDEHLGLLGLLNSSTACFWLKQVCHNKGSTVDAHGARQTTVEFENFYEFTGTKLEEFPLPADRPLTLTQHLDTLAQQRAATLPAALSTRLPLSRAELDSARAQADTLLQQMIAAQEELDWWCYRAYGLPDAALTHPAPPPLALGQRAFEIVLARQMKPVIARSAPADRGNPVTLLGNGGHPASPEEPGLLRCARNDDSVNSEEPGLLRCARNDDSVNSEEPGLLRCARNDDDGALATTGTVIARSVSADRGNPAPSLEAGRDLASPQEPGLLRCARNDDDGALAMTGEVETPGIETTWFTRHRSTPITELPSHWPADYRALVERRIALIESNPWLELLERPEYKRRWNQPAWEELEAQALREWLLDRLEAAGSAQGGRGGGPPAAGVSDYWPEPALQRIDQLSAVAERDASFMAVAALYTSQAGFDLPALLADLLQTESVPALAALRYTDTGLRKRADWEHTWQQQRMEDAIDAAVAVELTRPDDETPEEWQARANTETTHRKQAQVGTLPAPPKYARVDFQHNDAWRLRGALDVPKERWLRLPDPLQGGQWLYGWAGWTPAQRVQAIAGTLIDAETRHGVPVPTLIPLYAAIAEELPWVKQWHNTIDPDFGLGMGDYFDQWLRGELQKHGLTRAKLTEWRPEKAMRRGRPKAAQ